MALNEQVHVFKIYFLKNTIHKDLTSHYLTSGRRNMPPSQMKWYFILILSPKPIHNMLQYIMKKKITLRSENDIKA